MLGYQKRIQQLYLIYIHAIVNQKQKLFGYAGITLPVFPSVWV